MAVETLFPYGTINTVDTTGPANVHHVRMQMQGGSLYNGFPEYSYDDEHFFNSCHSIMMLGVETCTLTSVDVEADETLKIYCYNSDGGYTAFVNSISSIPSGTCFVKFMLTKETAYTSMPVLTVTVSGTVRFRKNSLPSLVAERKFCFETEYPYKFEQLSDPYDSTTPLTTGAYYLGNDGSTRYYDLGYLRLPPNYDPEGAPVPLVIYLHGTNSWMPNKYSPYMPNISTPTGSQEFIANNGYAVCDCLGLTNKYKIGPYDQNNPDPTMKANDAFFAPSYITSVVNLVKFIGANYNVDVSGVYLYSKSAGGYTLHMLTQTQGLNIRAAASLAPGISVLSKLHYDAYYEWRALRIVCEQLGLGDEWNDNEATWKGTTVLLPEFKAFILNHIHEFRQVDPLFCGSSLTDEQLRTIVSDLYSYDVCKPNSTTTKRSFALIPEKVSGTYLPSYPLINDAKLRVSVPTKIWIAPDDTNVQYDEVLLYVNSAQRAGSPVYLRLMPKNTGAHYSVEEHSGNTCAKVDYTPKYSSTTVNVPVAYAELIDWFNRF